jgi:hypothetical protein
MIGGRGGTGADNPPPPESEVRFEPRCADQLLAFGAASFDRKTIWPTDVSSTHVRCRPVHDRVKAVSTKHHVVQMSFGQMSLDQMSSYPCFQSVREREKLIGDKQKYWVNIFWGKNKIKDANWTMEEIHQTFLTKKPRK